MSRPAEFDSVFGIKTKPVNLDPPPGMSPSFWQGILKQTDRRYGFLTSSGDHSFGPYNNKAELLKAITEEATNKWKTLPGPQRDVYTKADAEGAKFDPTSTAGINEQQLREGQARYDTAMGAHTQDVGEQRQNLYKLKAQSDPRITAEEKLMMEMTRREADADYKGKVGATMNDMQARGMSGSGAELTRNLAGASDSANRHAIEALGARANAQKRAMDSLGKASDLSTTMATASGQDVQNASNRIDTDEDTQFDLANAAEAKRNLR